MTESTRRFSEARRAASQLMHAFESHDTFDDALAIVYHRNTRALAQAVENLARAALPTPPYPFEGLKADVEGRMRQLFGGRVDQRLLRITRYTRPHPELYALLCSRLGEPVPAWRLRLLTADAVHTERRVRELRDLGLAVEASEDESGGTYTLLNLEPDLTYAAAFQLRDRAHTSRAIDPFARRAAIELAELTADLPPRGALSER